MELKEALWLLIDMAETFHDESEPDQWDAIQTVKKYAPQIETLDKLPLSPVDHLLTTGVWTNPESSIAKRINKEE